MASGTGAHLAGHVGLGAPTSLRCWRRVSCITLGTGTFLQAQMCGSRGSWTLPSPWGHAQQRVSAPGQTCSSASCGWLCLLFFEVGLQLGDFKKETKTCKQTKINKRYPQRPQPLRGAWSPNSRAWESDPYWTVTLTSDCEERNHVAMKWVLDDQNHHVGATEASLFLSLTWPSLMPPRSPVLL